MSLKSIFRMAIISRVILICWFIVLLQFPQKTYPIEVNLPFTEVAQSADLIFTGTVAKQECYLNEQQTLIMTEVIFEDVQIVHSKTTLFKKILLLSPLPMQEVALKNFVSIPVIRHLFAMARDIFYLLVMMGKSILIP